MCYRARVSSVMMCRYRAKASLHALAPHRGGTLLFTAAIVANGLMFEVATSDCGLHLPLRLRCCFNAKRHQSCFLFIPELTCSFNRSPPSRCNHSFYKLNLFVRGCILIESVRGLTVKLPKRDRMSLSAFVLATTVYYFVIV